MIFLIFILIITNIIWYLIYESDKSYIERLLADIAWSRNQNHKLEDNYNSLKADYEILRRDKFGDYQI